jgi:hypothetical protein
MRKIGTLIPSLTLMVSWLRMFTVDLRSVRCELSCAVRTIRNPLTDLREFSISVQQAAPRILHTGLQ